MNSAINIFTRPLSWALEKALRIILIVSALALANYAFPASLDGISDVPLSEATLGDLMAAALVPFMLALVIAAAFLQD